MNNIPIFDSLTHPTIDSNWILPDYPQTAGINTLTQQMHDVNIKWAFAVGIKGIGRYNDAAYIKMIRNSGNKILYPIAFYDPVNRNVKNIKESLVRLKKMGYSGIKLHPRISDFMLKGHIPNVIKIANDKGLICMLCTYPYGHNLANNITPVHVMEMLSKTDDAKVILMHSGAVRLLEYMEIGRAFRNVLLDLSMTICKYEGSSIDLDLEFMFQQFDRRICIGSDFPEYTLAKLRERFKLLSKNIDLKKKENITFRNISSFCDLNVSL